MSEASTPTAHEPVSARLVLDRYRLGRRLGAGAFGVVWVAFDERLQREVAVKEIPRDGDGPAAIRAEREARVAARLNHPGIVSLYELGADAGAVYLVSELVRGRTLAELIRRGALADRDIARVGLALCDALAHAHERGVVHRDVKPQNVIVVAQPAAGAGFAKLTDFGVAHLASGDPLTRTGDVVGTLAYMAPEQAEGGGAEAPADVYSLALTLYEAWTGDNPVRGNGLVATARRLGGPIPSLREARPDLPSELTGAIDSALDADPGWRPPLAVLRESLAHAEPSLGDAGGLVDPATQRRFGLAPAIHEPPTSSTRRLSRASRVEPAPAPPTAYLAPEPDLDPERDLHAGPGRRAGSRRFVPGRDLDSAAGAVAVDPPAPPRRRLAGVAARGLAAVAAGALTVGALAWAGTPDGVDPGAAGLGAGLLVALLPRLGTLGTAALLLAWIAVGPPAAAGTALVLAVAVAAVAVLLPRRGTLWPLAGLGALVALPGAAAAFPALAAPVRGVLARAAFGASGYACLLAAELIAGRGLLFEPVAGVESVGVWDGSAGAALSGALIPTAISGALVPAGLWAALAVAGPLLVTGRGLAVDALGAALWAALAAGGTLLLAEALTLEPVAPAALLGGGAGGLALLVLARVARAAPHDGPPDEHGGARPRHF